MLPACLAHLAAEKVGVIVVDNASQDDSAGVARASGARVVSSPRNEGYGRGNGLGIAEARTRFVLICNPDLMLGSGAVAALLEAAALFPEAGLLAPLVSEPDGRRFVPARSLLSPAHLNHAGKALVPEGPASIPFVSGACFLIEKALFDAIGGFDPEIFLFYEDDDLCRRLMDRGRAPVLVPAATALHQRGASSAPVPGQRFRTRWHGAWSEAHVRARYGLPPPSRGKLWWNRVRAGLNAALRRTSDHERYAGSVAGALAYQRGETALEREGLATGPDADVPT
ncbi:MAG: glycosyltransferase [Beijerinckiaceae bacterium]|nr:glycosyltransferase [Beijerinckiaceae bacterium]